MHYHKLHVKCGSVSPVGSISDFTVHKWVIGGLSHDRWSLGWKYHYHSKVGFHFLTHSSYERSKQWYWIGQWKPIVVWCYTLLKSVCILPREMRLITEWTHMDQRWCTIDRTCLHEWRLKSTLIPYICTFNINNLCLYKSIQCTVTSYTCTTQIFCNESTL